MEVLFPVGVVGLDTSGQFADIVVVAVPTWQVLDVVLHRVVSGYEVRVDIAAQILIP